MKGFLKVKYPLTKLVLVSTIFFILLSIAKVVGSFAFTDSTGAWLSVLIYVLFILESH